MPRDHQLVSADSHVLEPPHIWTMYMPKKFHDKVPRVVPDGEGGEAPVDRGHRSRRARPSLVARCRGRACGWAHRGRFIGFPLPPERGMT